MIITASNPQFTKDKMYSDNVQSITLPTTFGKCLNTKTVDPRNLNICEIPKTPKSEPKGTLLVDYAIEHFEQKGKLKLDERGFFYIDLNNDYIYEMFELLECEGAELPPYFAPQKGFGAHISAALCSEVFDREEALQHVDKEITFSITGCYYVKPEQWEGVKRVWFFTVEAPELLSIRESLGLEEKIMGHEFHITFAIEKEFLSLGDFLFFNENKEIEINKTKSLQQKVRQMRRLTDNKA